MLLFKKLAELANQLDEMGHPEAANEVDELLRDDNFLALFKPEQELDNKEE